MNTILSYALYFLLYPFIKLLWEPFSKKKSHWIHWKNINLGLYSDDIVRVPGDKNAKPRDSFWSMFWQTNFGWKKIVVVKPTEDCHTLTKYRVGFLCEYNNDNQQICTKWISRDNAIALLVGNKPLVVFALDQDGNQIPLQKVFVGRKNNLPNDVNLF